MQKSWKIPSFLRKTGGLLKEFLGSSWGVPRDNVGITGQVKVYDNAIWKV